MLDIAIKRLNHTPDFEDCYVSPFHLPEYVLISNLTNNLDPHSWSSLFSIVESVIVITVISKVKWNPPGSSVAYLIKER